MSESLAKYLRDMITHHGPISVAQFMEICLGHPRHGYYMTRDPFGAECDFITAPEISQMFGELLGAWVADCWLQLGRPSPFIWLDCGPGRGTLMCDMWRATRKVQGMHEAAHIYMLEASPYLRNIQERTCGHFNTINWIASLDDLPRHAPVLATGNEFLDALSVHQFHYKNGQWYERVVGLDDNNALTFGLGAVPDALSARMPESAPDDERVYEVSPQREAFIDNLSARIGSQGGACLFIDYGYAGPAYGDTLQAVNNHAFCYPLANPGDCDVTAHVDFTPLRNIAYRYDLKATVPVDQKLFLRRLGIDQRYAILDQHCSKAQGDALHKAYTRLMDDDQMGSLFKAIAICPQEIRPGGFTA